MILDQDKDGTLLLRYALDGAFAGDTWHATEHAAKSQAAHEFGPLTWMEAPEQTESVDELALLYVRKAAR